MKRLSIFFFLAALLIAGVAIAAVVVRASDLLPPEPMITATAPRPAPSTSSN